MLDSLPTELVEHVVRLAVSSSFLPHLYHDRLATLTSLSLTSSKLRIVAQPILLEVVQLKSREAVESFLAVVEADKALGARVRSVRDEGHYDNDNGETPVAEAGTFRRLSSSCSWVNDLRVHRHELKMEWLDGFDDLRRLVVSHGTIWSSGPLSFPKLAEISLGEPSLGETLLSDSNFPL
ncbi:hypothetical protein JCM8547_008656 [Rhodosporidiobolus lusitaniae]